MSRFPPQKKSEEAPVVYLYPGDIHATAEDVVLRTVLGSCVSVCLWDPETGAGGMNHFLLARMPAGGGPVGRYGDSATLVLIEKVLALGVSRKTLKAKVFGGAGIFGTTGNLGQLGRENARSAFEVLRLERIKVMGRDVGGAWGRRLIFRLRDGAISSVRLGSAREE